MKTIALHDEQALAALADLLDPLEEIASDPEVKDTARGGGSGLRCGAVILRRHPKAVMTMLGILRGTGEYHCTLAEALRDITAVLSDEELAGLFFSARQTQTSPDCACGKAGA